MKVTLANMVLTNANLTNEVTVLRRILGQYDLATSQDLYSILNWMVGKVNGGRRTPLWQQPQQGEYNGKVQGQGQELLFRRS